MSDTKLGTIKLINPIMEVGAKKFMKREFVVTVTDGKYPQDLQFELAKDRCDQVDKFQPGDEVTVHYDIRGREYNGKYYVNLQAWKVEGEGSAPSKPAPMSKAGLAQQSLNPDDEIPDVPF